MLSLFFPSYTLEAFVIAFYFNKSPAGRVPLNPAIDPAVEKLRSVSDGAVAVAVVGSRNSGHGMYLS